MPKPDINRVVPNKTTKSDTKTKKSKKQYALRVDREVSIQAKTFVKILNYRGQKEFLNAVFNDLYNNLSEEDKVKYDKVSKYLEVLEDM